ncbi:DinB family protein [Tamlana sp. 2_MG-2023]|uniref:DinB family protein n=1 Tax=unclassified Tamlana TaxID=2614803 RepID=UPI0026E11DB6|nr:MULTISPECIES: DinB family protein [unclassified Tamlana]MDO6761717.1 DinB family protein [Tamlana sp. 2_MG-2023]MDO6792271.1 DinB family protein [Tamlana sp. 1_MG-2023]
MQNEILSQLFEQNKKDCSHFCKNINTENSAYRLTAETASVGFIYRHIGETTNLIGQFFGHNTDIEGTTIGKKDTETEFDLETSRMYFENGYNTLDKLIANTSDQEWLEEIETTWFGKIARIKLFSILLNHNTHHCGQISSAIVKGKKFKKNNE